MKKMCIPFSLNILLFILTLVLNSKINIDPPIWTGYGDPYDYLYQSEIPLTSRMFYFPEKVDNFYPRPFTVPLFYKMVGSQPDHIILMQKIVHALSAFFLCMVIFQYLQKVYTKVLFAVFWYLLMSWWNIMGWTHTLLSESLSMSFGFLWLASFLLFFRKKNGYTFLVHVVVTVLFSFTRDSWPYILLAFYGLFTGYAFFREKSMRSFGFGLIVLAALLYVVQGKSASIGQRYRLPIMNNIVFRIVPEEDYLEWFVREGMPQGDELKDKYGYINNWQEIYPLYSDSSFVAFSDWVVKEGKSTYTKFLLTHPDYLLLLQERPDGLGRMLAYNLDYTGEPKGFSIASESMFPLFGVVSMLVLNALLVFIFIKKKKDMYLFPSLLILVFAFNAHLLYIADALEVERHLFITHIMIQFIGILTVVLILDSGFGRSLFSYIVKRPFKVDRNSTLEM